MSLSNALRLKDIGASHAAILSASRIWTPARLGLGTTSAWFDPSDTTSLFQSRTGGSNGVVGSPVGIMLDKSQMNGLSAEAFIAAQLELVANGDFASDTVWSKGTGWTISGGAASQSGAGANSNLAQSSILPSVGNWAECTFTITRSAGTLIPFFGSANLGTFSSGGTFTVVGAVAGNTTLTFQANSTFVGTVDNVSVKAIPGNHAIAAADSNRPVLRNPSGSLYELEYDGVDDYFALTSAISITTDMTVIRAFKRASAGINSNGLGASGAGVPYETRWRDSDNKVYAGLGGIAAATPDTADTATGGFVFSSLRDVTTETIRRNGSVLGSRSAAAVSGALNNIGRINTIYNSGRMAGLLLIPRTLTASELAQAERYFGAQVGLSL